MDMAVDGRDLKAVSSDLPGVFPVNPTCKNTSFCGGVAAYYLSERMFL